MGVCLCGKLRLSGGFWKGQKGNGSFGGHSIVILWLIAIKTPANFTAPGQNRRENKKQAIYMGMDIFTILI